MTRKTVTLREYRDAGGYRYLGATLTALGNVVIEGQDLGDAVEKIFGAREYEWTWTIGATDVRRLLRALRAETDADVLAVLQKHFSDEKAATLSTFLDEHDIPYDVWTHIGD